MQTEHNISEEISARPTETMDQVAETADLLNEVRSGCCTESEHWLTTGSSIQKLLATLNALQTDNQAAINLKKEVRLCFFISFHSHSFNHITAVCCNFENSR